MKSNLVEALIGAVVLAVAVAFFSYTYDRTDMAGIDGYELVARFDRIDGLSFGSDVRLAGIKVGTVLGQSIDRETYQAVVRFSVSEDISLPSDSSAKVASEGLLGGSYVSLTPGGMDEYLEDGDEVELTQGAIDLQIAINIPNICNSTTHTSSKIPSSPP